MPKELIFLVEDDEHIQKLMNYNLESAGYTITAFSSGEELLETIKKTTPDMFILDIMLPGLDGLEVCRKLKENPVTRSTPMIMVTAKGDEFDRVLGLELGADDYITKPFSVRELVARVKALFRRVNNNNPPIEACEDTVIVHDGIAVDINRREVTKNGMLIEMPLKEFELLKELILNKGKVMSRDELLEKVWGYDYFGDTRTVDVHVRYLRQKIEDDPGKPVYIDTVRGIGYRFSDRSG